MGKLGADGGIGDHIGAALMEDGVQGDQEGRLHGDDGNADGNRMAPRHAGQFHDAPL